MRPIDERALRASFINATRKEISDISLPPGFDEIDFDRLDYLGWTDPKLPRRSYVVVWIDDVVTGVVLQRAEQRVLARAQCSWCEDVTLRNDVQLYTARKAGPAGRKGDTIGNLTCAEFGCSKNVRVLPPLAYQGYDRELAREMRILKLQEHVTGFVRDVAGDTA
ncbi:FBP domain-containing protein [Microbacterium hydrocarbonoxydans]|uniref:FBP domain-containing protein n=1 Tax=Microbacterium hydrocarbonoxydans TaxID=273678 RepID=UPI00203DBFFD|nr:FBP domain-containing protein [Microbacterium hydrocarbonoxydans]MCM3779759.1 FBP domain-containing protein [Microbacterium hydrocarbonoxydans]